MPRSECTEPNALAANERTRYMSARLTGRSSPHCSAPSAPGLTGAGGEIPEMYCSTRLISRAQSDRQGKNTIAHPPGQPTANEYFSDSPLASTVGSRGCGPSGLVSLKGPFSVYGLLLGLEPLASRSGRGGCWRCQRRCWSAAPRPLPPRRCKPGVPKRRPADTSRGGAE
jgi:hypothetical protein